VPIDEIQTRRNVALRSVERNARQLLLDAELLFDHGRYGRAAALAILSIEEVGKFYLLKWSRTETEVGQGSRSETADSCDFQLG
jgi:AbiV family abortive infection protein